jgi:hypothetical protein
MADALRIRAFGIGATVDLWRQPDILADQTSDPLHVGAGATATVAVPLPSFLRSRWSDFIQVTAGYKARGYVPGEQLSGGAVLRAGITLR